jgi:hypothetical protein
MRPPLGPGERVLAAEGDGNGGSVVATTLGLYHRNHVKGNHATDWNRLGWEEAGRVSWDARSGLLDVVGITAPDHLRAIVPRGMVALVRERVAATLLLSSRAAVADGVIARLVARRRPGSADLVWFVLLDRSADGDDPAVRAGVAQAIQRLRAGIGV